MRGKDPIIKKKKEKKTVPKFGDLSLLVLSDTRSLLERRTRDMKFHIETIFWVVGNIGRVPGCGDIVLDIMARYGYLKEHIIGKEGMKEREIGRIV